MITVVNVLKRRNNAVSNLALGAASGLSQIGWPVETIKYETESIEGWRRISPSSIPAGTEWLIVPYWISDGLWDINLATVKRERPELKIATFTGTSPFWHGAATIDYHPGSKWLEPKGLSGDRLDNFKAVDVFLVVWPRPGVNPLNQFSVGMGTFPEVQAGPKAGAPTIVMDFMKEGWDEDVYAESASVVAAIATAQPDVRVHVLGANKIAAKMFDQRSGQYLFVTHQYVPFADMCSIWRQAWAFVALNESFGYCLPENWLSGTQVFASKKCEMPPCHDTIPLEMLSAHIDAWRAMGYDARCSEAKAIAAAYKGKNPQFCSWKGVAERMVAALFGKMESTT